MNTTEVYRVVRSRIGAKYDTDLCKNSQPPRSVTVWVLVLVLVFNDDLESEKRQWQAPAWFVRCLTFELNRHQRQSARAALQ